MFFGRVQSLMTNWTWSSPSKGWKHFRLGHGKIESNHRQDANSIHSFIFHATWTPFFRHLVKIVCAEYKGCRYCCQAFLLGGGGRDQNLGRSLSGATKQAAWKTLASLSHPQQDTSSSSGSGSNDKKKWVSSKVHKWMQGRSESALRNGALKSALKTWAVDANVLKLDRSDWASAEMQQNINFKLQTYLKEIYQATSFHFLLSLCHIFVYK